MTTATWRHPAREPRTNGFVRALKESDIPALTALRRASFAYGERTSNESLEAFFRTVFLDNPWKDMRLPSLVYENSRGDIAGFLGIIPRRMLVNNRPIRVAVATQLMVAAGTDGLAGLRLTRAFINGPQDLCLSDIANAAARRLWVSVSGYTSPMLSMQWLRRLRHTAHMTRRFRDGPLGRAARAVASPVCALLDAGDGRMLSRDVRADGTITTLLTAKGVCEDQHIVLGSRAVRPLYDPASLQWLLDRASEKQQFGPMRALRVGHPDRGPLGWFMYHLGANGIASVLQIAARERCEDQVLRRLFHDAWLHGAVAVSGRAEPWLMPALLRHDRVSVSQGPWTLLHSRSPEVVYAIERGTGYISRLDGEWWLSF